jgi:hypothetical protein
MNVSSHVVSAEIREGMKKKKKKVGTLGKALGSERCRSGANRLRARHPEDFFSGLVAAKTGTA